MNSWAQISGTAEDTNSGSVSMVKLVINNLTDDLYWKGSVWGSHTWLNAVGKESWAFNINTTALTNGK